MLELLDVSKVYRGGRRAVDALTLRIDTGVLGLLGPNGAGKSSLMRIAATVTRPTSGRVLFDGVDVVARPDALRRTLGYLPQDFGVHPHLTAREFLAYLAAVKGLSARSARTRIPELLELVNLTGAAKRPLGGYSGGMLRRIGIAQALLADPRVIVVDEPPQGWTHRSGSGSARSWLTSPRTGPCCSPPTSSPIWRPSPTTSRCSPPVGYCTAAASTGCSTPSPDGSGS